MERVQHRGRTRRPLLKCAKRTGTIKSNVYHDPRNGHHDPFARREQVEGRQEVVVDATLSASICWRHRRRESHRCGLFIMMARG